MRNIWAVARVTVREALRQKAALTLPDGRVHIAARALEMGLTDGIRSFDEVLAELQESGSKNNPRRTRNEAAGTAAEADLLSRRLALETL